jgi:hypothetical protein
MARLRATALAARSVLDGREHGGTLGCVGSRFTPVQPSPQKARAHHDTEFPLDENIVSSLDTDELNEINRHEALKHAQQQANAFREPFFTHSWQNPDDEEEELFGTVAKHHYDNDYDKNRHHLIDVVHPEEQEKQYDQS